MYVKELIDRVDLKLSCTQLGNVLGRNSQQVGLKNIYLNSQQIYMHGKYKLHTGNRIWKQALAAYTFIA